MPGDLHKLWRTRDRKGYHVEYGFSCMGYEIAGGLGVRMADPDRDVFVMVGDGSYLMMATELATAVQEGIKVIVVLVQNHGFASIGSLSEMLGSQRFGTAYRYRDARPAACRATSCPIDLAANAASFGIDVVARTHGRRVHRGDQDRQGQRHQHRHPRRNRPADPRPRQPNPGGTCPFREVSTLESTQQAYETYAEWKQVQRPFLRPTD